MSGAGYHEPPPRGVWVLPFRDHPVQPLTAAITSDGRLLAMLPVPAVTAIPAIEKPRCGPALLDEADPAPARPRLELVRGTARPKRGARR